MISEDYLKLCDQTADEANLVTVNVRSDYLTRIGYWWTYAQDYMTGSESESVKHDHLYSALAELAKWGFLQLSTMMDKTPEDIATLLKETHKRKNAGYSGDDPDPWSNFREIEKFGISAATGCLTRLSDKYVRFKNVYKNPELDKVNESALDTMIDFVAYCIILMCLLEELP